MPFYLRAYKLQLEFKSTDTMTTETFTLLQNQLNGRMIRPNDEEYDEARKVYNGIIEKRPAAIVYCNDVEDVKVCVNFARENGVPMAVRCGGHNAAGFGICDGGLVID